jgi:hypothetical protein
LVILDQLSCVVVPHVLEVCLDAKTLDQASEPPTDKVEIQRASAARVRWKQVAVPVIRLAYAPQTCPGLLFMLAEDGISFWV